MTNPVSHPPQDFQKKCRQADREHESRKIAVLLERVRQQIAERDRSGERVESPKPPTVAIAKSMPIPMRSALFER